jgi:serine/threonine-protein kinase RIM15
LLNRQTRDARTGPDHRGSGHVHGSSSRSTSVDAPRLSSPFYSTSENNLQSYFNARSSASGLMLSSATDDVSESSGSESISSLFLRGIPSTKRTPKESPVQSFSDLTNDLRSHSNANAGRSTAGTPPIEPRFVGTPDYLAPEIILGYGGEDRVVDWVCFLHLFANHGSSHDQTFSSGR